MADEKKTEKTAEEKMNDICGTRGDGTEYVTGRGYNMKIYPTSIRNIPKLNSLYNKFTELNQSGKSFQEESVISLMAEIIELGLKEDNDGITAEKCMDMCSLSDFPKILDIMLDLNDFFGSMRNLMVKSNAMAAVEKSAK